MESSQLQKGEDGEMVSTVEKHGNETLRMEGEEPMKTYLEILVGKKMEMNAEGGETDERDSDENVPSHEAEEEDCPTISIKKEEKERLRIPWKQTLIIKIWGRTVNYNYLLRTMRTLWRPKADMELIAIENDYYLVRFSLVDAYSVAKYEGLWFVLDHYLIMKS